MKNLKDRANQLKTDIKIIKSSHTYYNLLSIGALLL